VTDDIQKNIIRTGKNDFSRAEIKNQVS